MPFVLFGGMVALQSSPNLDAAKLTYLVGGSVALFFASWSLWRRRGGEPARYMRRWLVASAVLVLLVGGSSIVAAAQGTPPTDWLRDAATYLLFASVPVFAIDAEASIPRRWLVIMLVLAGVLGAFSWALEWLARRDILELPISRLLFASPHLPAMLYFFAAATAFKTDRRAWAWAVLAGVILGLFFMTGTRSSLLLLVAPATMIVLAGRERIPKAVGWFAVQGAAAVVVVLSLQVALWAGPIGGTTDPPGDVSTPRPEVIGERFGELGTVIANPRADPSIRERIAQYEASWRLFNASPIVGVGLGHQIEWTDVSGYERSAYTADTPLVFVAKFGAVGLIVVVLLATAYFRTVRDLLRARGRSVVFLTLVGYGVWVLVALPLGFPIEDKGAGLALILVLGLALSDLVAPAPVAQEEAVGARPLLASDPP